jgi:hypothetical protein
VVDHYDGSAWGTLSRAQAGRPCLRAVARAVHREEPQPWVIDDYLALHLAGQEGLALLERLRAELPRPFLLAFGRWVCVRAGFPRTSLSGRRLAGWDSM